MAAPSPSFRKGLHWKLLGGRTHRSPQLKPHQAGLGKPHTRGWQEAAAGRDRGC